MKTQNTFTSHGIRSGQWSFELDGSLFGSSINATFVVEYDVSFSRNERVEGSFQSERVIVHIKNPRILWSDCSLFFDGDAVQFSESPQLRSMVEREAVEVFEEQIEDVILFERDRR